MNRIWPRIRSAFANHVIAWLIGISVATLGLAAGVVTGAAGFFHDFYNHHTVELPVWRDQIGRVEVTSEGVEFRPGEMATAAQQSNAEVVKTLERVEQMLRRGLMTHAGRAVLRDCCDGDTDYWVAINSNPNSAVSRYPQGTILKITRMEPPIFSFEARVDGEFTADNPEYLIQVNRRGWARLRNTADAAEIRVVVEEVEK